MHSARPDGATGQAADSRIRDITEGLFLSLASVILLSACVGEEQRPAPQRVTNPASQYQIRMATNALNADDPEAALSYALRAEKADPSSAEAAFVAALTFERLNRRADAEAAYRRALAIDPAYPDAWLKLGNIAYKEKDFREAMERYRRAVETSNTADAWYNLGASYLSMLEIDSAEAAFSAALARNPHLALAHAGLVDVYEYGGDLPAATAHADSALRLGHGSAELRKKLGLLYLRQGRTEEAAGALRGAAERFPLDAETQFALAQAYQRLGESAAAEVSFRRHEEARAAADRIARLESRVHEHPGDLAALRTLANLLMLSGRHGEAADTYVRLLKVSPEDLEARLALGSIYAARGEIAAAERSYRQVLLRDSTHASAWLYLGLLLKMSGSQADATRALNTAKRLEPRLAARIDGRQDAAR